MRKPDKTNVILFTLGATGYSALELLWRGRTHWTMGLTGGACLVAMHHVNGRMQGRPLWTRCLAGSAVITAAELAVGCVVNRALGWQVWDYATLPLNLWGQICPAYSCLWALLSAPVMGMSSTIHRVQRCNPVPSQSVSS